jgi:hypothetical protein
MAAATAAAGDGAACDDVMRAAAAAAAAAAGAAALTWQTYFESAASAKQFAGLQRRLVALARDFFELCDVGAPPAAPPAEVAAAAAAAARAAARAAAAAAFAGESGAAAESGAGDAAACAADAGEDAAPMDAALAAAEAAVWGEYAGVAALQRALRLRSGGGARAGALRAARPPFAARAMRPLPPPAADAPLARLRPAGGLPVDPAWPGVRRACRASFALAAALPELSRGADRHALLAAPCAAARLRALAKVLATRRATLAALAAVEGARVDADAADEADEAEDAGAA